MKFTCNKDELLKYVNNISRLATARATLPILQNIYLLVSGDKLTIKATDLEQTLEATIDGEGLDNGSITVPARLLTEYLQNNTDKAITITTNDLTVKVSSANHQATLRGTPADDYPTLPKTDYKITTVISAANLNDAITKVLFSSANDETRPILTGLLFKIVGDELTIVGTDGYRLAKTTLAIKNGVDSEFVIPKRSLQELLRLLPLDEEVTLSLAQTQCRAMVGKVELISRVLEGSFPSYEAILPKKSNFEMSVNSAVLLQSLKLASLFSRDSAFSTNMEMEENKMSITATSPTLGENTNQITLEKKVDEKFQISVNAQYLIDILTVLSGDVILKFIDQKSPIILTPGNDSKYLYLVMPLRTQ